MRLNWQQYLLPPLSISLTLSCQCHLKSSRHLEKYHTVASVLPPIHWHIKATADAQGWKIGGFAGPLSACIVLDTHTTTAVLSQNASFKRGQRRPPFIIVAGGWQGQMPCWNPCSASLPPSPQLAQRLLYQESCVGSTKASILAKHSSRMQ